MVTPTRTMGSTRSHQSGTGCISPDWTDDDWRRHDPRELPFGAIH